MVNHSGALLLGLHRPRLPPTPPTRPDSRFYYSTHATLSLTLTITASRTFAKSLCANVRGRSQRHGGEKRSQWKLSAIQKSKSSFFKK